MSAELSLEPAKTHGDAAGHLEKVICKDCDSHFLIKDLLQAPNPFEPGEVIHGCPCCNSISSTVYACDYQGCRNEVTCGLPTKNGYRSVCGQHYRELDSQSDGDPNAAI